MECPAVRVARSFTASPWKRATSGTSTAPTGASKTGYFKTPSGNIVCGYGYDGKDPRAAACSRTLTLILSTVDERRFRQLLKPGQEARAVITVRATDKIGNSDTEKRTVAVR
jgi:ribosomal protein L34E